MEDLEEGQSKKGKSTSTHMPDWLGLFLQNSLLQIFATGTVTY